jgi:hypothetical protein
VRELALRLLAGQQLTHCHGAGWSVGPELVPVDASVLRQLQTGFRLVPGGDALPGFAPSMSQTLMLEPLRSNDDVLGLLHPAVRAAGGPTAYARRHGLSKSSVVMVEGASRDMTPAVAATLGMVPYTAWKPAEAKATATRPPRLPRPFEDWMLRFSRLLRQAPHERVRETAAMRLQRWKDCWTEGMTPQEAYDTLRGEDRRTLALDAQRPSAPLRNATKKRPMQNRRKHGYRVHYRRARGGAIYTAFAASERTDGAHAEDNWL